MRVILVIPFNHAPKEHATPVYKVLPDQGNLSIKAKVACGLFVSSTSKKKSVKRAFDSLMKKNYALGAINSLKYK